MLDELSAEHRLLLLQFLCAFAWTDMQVNANERKFIERLMTRFDLSEEDRDQVGEWLALAPAPSSVEPNRVPVEHRHTFVEAVRALIYSDGGVDVEEREHFEKLKQALS
jgi:uncharacterized tellurite resistance protein B-like protein